MKQKEKGSFTRKIYIAGGGGLGRSEGRSKPWFSGRREEEGKMGNMIFNKY